VHLRTSAVINIVCREGVVKSALLVHVRSHELRQSHFRAVCVPPIQLLENGNENQQILHWTKWTGPDPISLSEPWDKTFAHKPWMLKHDVLYHFYCAVGDEGPAIALATSKDLRASWNDLE
jgi:hypothetical protein